MRGDERPVALYRPRSRGARAWRPAGRVSRVSGALQGPRFSPDPQQCRRRGRGDGSDAGKLRRRLRGAGALRWRAAVPRLDLAHRSEEQTSELQSLMRISYAVFCLNKKTNIISAENYIHTTI